MDDRTDSELTEQVKAGDVQAFEELVHRHDSSVRTHVARVMGTGCEAPAVEDVVQEVWIKVWTRSHQFKSIGSFPAWLCVVAGNLAKNHLRTVSRRREEPLDEVETTWPDRRVAHSPELAVELLEKGNLLSQCIEQLPYSKRQVVRLALEYELEPKEIAQKLSLPSGTVRSRLHHARRILAPLLSGVDEDC